MVAFYARAVDGVVETGDRAEEFLDEEWTGYVAWEDDDGGAGHVVEGEGL